MRVHCPEPRSAPISIRVAVDHAIEQVSDLRFELDSHRRPERKDLEDFDVLAERRKPSHVAITLRRVPELKRTGLANSRASTPSFGRDTSTRLLL